MTAIWQNNGTGWRLLAPTGFPDEQTLHDLVEETPQLLPLAGDSSLVVVGKEVLLGNGYADLVAIEPSGRLVILKIKLSKNAEARRAVVAQILTYAAHLKGLSPETVEREVLGHHLHNRGYKSLQDAVASNDQEGSFESTSFSEGLTKCLAEGHFRLVLVLDEASQELVTLVGYLESVTEELSIDLITVSAYDVGNSQVLVLRDADIILLLVSSTFMASDYVDAKEVSVAVDRHERGEARVIPIIVRRARWEQAPFASCVKPI